MQCMQPQEIRQSDFMRKLLFIVLAAILSSTASYSQEVRYDSNGRQDPSTIWVNKVNDGEEWRDENRWHDPFDIYAGPVVGVVASNLTLYDSKYYFAPYIGGIIQAYFNNHFGMSLEFAYTRQGARDAWANFMTDEDLNVTDDEGNVIGSRAKGPYEYRFDYINTLYKIRYYPVRRFNVFAGFLFGVHIGAKCDLDGDSRNIKGHLRKRAAHVVGGIGYELDNLFFEGYYGLPLSKLANSSQGKKVLRNAHEQTIMLTVGYRFKLY